jgi:hypothetical protein
MTDHIAALSRFSSSAAALCGCALHTTRVRTRDRSMPPPSALEDSPLKRRALRLRARRGATRGRQHGALAIPTLLHRESRGTPPPHPCSRGHVWKELNRGSDQNSQVSISSIGGENHVTSVKYLGTLQPALTCKSTRWCTPFPIPVSDGLKGACQPHARHRHHPRQHVGPGQHEPRWPRASHRLGRSVGVVHWRRTSAAAHGRRKIHRPGSGGAAIHVRSVAVRHSASAEHTVHGLAGVSHSSTTSLGEVRRRGRQEPARHADASARAHRRCR